MGGVYKSMSWSTSSRERAKLGRLDSEPPLLLREWPPETGQRDKGGGREEWGGAEGRGAGVTVSKESSEGEGEEVEEEGERREKERAEFTPLIPLVIKETALKEQFAQEFSPC